MLLSAIPLKMKSEQGVKKFGYFVENYGDILMKVSLLESKNSVLNVKLN